MPVLSLSRRALPEEQLVAETHSFEDNRYELTVRNR